MELPRSKQHECSRCHRNFNFAKTLEKHLLACKGISNIAVQMETPKDTLKGKGVDDEVFNGEIEIVPGSTEEAIPTYRTGVKTEIDNSKMELNYLITTNEAIMESTGDFVNGTLATEDDEKVTARESFNLYLTSDEEEQKERLKPREIIPCTPALRNRTPHEEVDPKNYKCEFCDATFTEPSQLEDHRNRHLEVKKRSSTQCHICFKSYKNYRVLYSHRFMHTSRHKCEHCSKIFQSAYHLKNHIKRHVGVKFTQKNVSMGTKPHKCPFCSAAFSSAAPLTRHTNINHKSEFQRAGDAQKISSKITFEDKRTKTSKDNEKNGFEDLELLDSNEKAVETKCKLVTAPVAAYICTVCSNAYQNRKALNRHLISHTSRFKCEHCNKTFLSAHALEGHNRRHLGLKPFECAVCKAVFFTKPGFNRHMISHSDRGHQCEICGRGFIKKSALKDHRNIHLGTKPHKCNYCTVAFSIAAALTRHMNYAHKSANKGVCDGQIFSNQTAKQSKDTEKFRSDNSGI